jgi:hypothetical protein
MALEGICQTSAELSGIPYGKHLLSGAAGLVFSDAVLEAAIGSSTLNKEA